MKKTYINPEMRVFKFVMSQQLLDGSVDHLNGQAGSETVGFAREAEFDDEEY